MDTRFLRRVSKLACLGFLLGASIFPAAAQEGPKLYVFTSGSLGGFPKAAPRIATGRSSTSPVLRRRHCSRCAILRSSRWGRRSNPWRP